MAELLGVSDVVARSVRMKTLRDGKETEGIFMEEAEGSDVNRIRDEQDPLLRVTPDGLDQPGVFGKIAALQALDFVCGNIDRHSGNLLYRFEEGPQGPRLTSVKGIDNDCSFGELLAKERDGVLEMVPCRKMRALGENMANRILAVSPAMLKTALKDYPLSETELEAACSRLEQLQTKLVEDSAYFAEHPEHGLVQDRIRVLKDGEWAAYSLNDLAGPSDGRSNYFGNLQALPGYAQKILSDRRKLEAEQGELERIHPELAVERQKNREPARGVRLDELDAASVNYASLRLEELGRKMSDVNSGFFFSSSEFNRMKDAFGSVRAQMRNAGRNLSDEQRNALTESFRTLQERTEKYLEKKVREQKDLEEKGKTPSEVMKRRMAFARELRKFTGERLSGLEAENRKAAAPRRTGEKISLSDLEKTQASGKNGRPQRRRPEQAETRKKEGRTLG